MFSPGAYLAQGKPSHWGPPRPCTALTKVFLTSTQGLQYGQQQVGSAWILLYLVLPLS